MCDEVGGEIADRPFCVIGVRLLPFPLIPSPPPFGLGFPLFFLIFRFNARTTQLRRCQKKEKINSRLGSSGTSELGDAQPGCDVQKERESKGEKGGETEIQLREILSAHHRTDVVKEKKG